MDKITLYTAEALAPAIAEGSKGFVSQNAWVNKMLDTFAGIVKSNPLAYRAFGPFWWPLKQRMISAGAFDGELPDATEVERISFGNAALDIAAAWSYQEYAINNMINMNNDITVDTESGDTFEYHLIDDEMELRANLHT